MFLFSDGFDHYVANGAPASQINTYLTQAGYVVNNATNSTFAVIDGMDTGSRALRMTIVSGSSTPPSMSRTIETDADKVVFGFAFRGTGSRMRFCRLNDIADIEWDAATGRIKVDSELGANVIIMNAWWYIEVVIDRTSNEVSVYANDTLQLEFEMSPSHGDTYTITWGMDVAQSSNATIDLDDFYIVDSSPGQNTDRLGPVAIITRSPTADVDKEWSVVGSPSNDHYQIASQLNPGAANAPYLQANVEGKRDTFTSNTVLPNNNQIFAVSVVAYARKGDLDEREIGLLVKTSNGEEELQRELEETFKYHQAVFEQAPGDIAWTQNSVESSQFGIIAR